MAPATASMFCEEGSAALRHSAGSRYQDQARIWGGGPTDHRSFFNINSKNEFWLKKKKLPLQPF